METIILTVANQKGGVGKTTTAINLAAALAQLGFPTLLVDADPQGNATSGVGVAKKSLTHSLYGVLTGEYGAADAILPLPICEGKLSLLPATIDLAGVEFDLIEREDQAHTLARAIRETGDRFRFVIIDCPPSLGLITINALSASSGILIPMQCEYFSLEGLTQLIQTFRRVKKSYNPALTITGILVTMYDGRLNLSTQVLEELKKYYSDKLFKTVIPRNVRLSEAPSHGLPVICYDPYSRGSQAYTELAKELRDRLF